MRRLASTSIPVRSSHSSATIVLTVVAFIATALTSLKIGPVWGLGDRYGLPDELVIGYLQLFLLDCGLILLPLSVSVSQQRLSAARAAAGRELLDGLVASATGTAIIATDRSGRSDLPSGASFVDICADVAASATPRRLWQLRAGGSRMGLTSIPLS